VANLISKDIDETLCSFLFFLYMSLYYIFREYDIFRYIYDIFRE